MPHDPDKQRCLQSSQRNSLESPGHEHAAYAAPLPLMQHGPAGKSGLARQWQPTCASLLAAAAAAAVSAAPLPLARGSGESAG